MKIPEGKKLGNLCKSGHNWEGTGNSLRYVKGGRCVNCVRERMNRPKVRARQKNLRCERMKDPEVRAKYNKIKRQRMKDLDLRAKHNRRNRNRRKDPEIRSKDGERQRVRMKDPNLRAKLKKYNRDRYNDPEIRSKLKEYNRNRRKDPEIRAKQNKRLRERLATDENYAIKRRLRSRLGRWMNGSKSKRACEYGIDYQAIADHLGLCPGDRSDYEIHHIQRLELFDFSDPDEIREAWMPENHMWLTIEEHVSIHANDHTHLSETSRS